MAGSGQSTAAEPDNLPPVLRLRWDFKSRFPQPLDEAVDAGLICAEDTLPQSVEAIHQQHAQKMLGTLTDLDTAMEVRRSDPQAAIQLRDEQKLSEPTRLQRWYASLLGIYEEWFGAEAATAFDKAVRAWHARIEVVIDKDPPGGTVAIDTHNPHPAAAPPVIDAEIVDAPLAPTRTLPPPPKRIIARLPVPRPLPIAIDEAHFGVDEQGQPIRPAPDEVREVTEAHADKLIHMLDESRGAPSFERDQMLSRYHDGIVAYERSFGERAARQLDSYVQRQAEQGGERRPCGFRSPGAAR